MSTEVDHYRAALDMAAEAREAYREKPSTATFRTWRDASEIAIKWNRACRLGTDTNSIEDELEALVASK